MIDLGLDHLKMVVIIIMGIYTYIIYRRDQDITMLPKDNIEINSEQVQNQSIHPTCQEILDNASETWKDKKQYPSQQSLQNNTHTPKKLFTSDMIKSPQRIQTQQSILPNHSNNLDKTVKKIIKKRKLKNLKKTKYVGVKKQKNKLIAKINKKNIHVQEVNS